VNRVTLPIAEIFGPTFQGEGPSAGQVAAFIRLGGCNLTCRDCDTAYTWDAGRYDLRTEITNTPVLEVIEQVPNAPLVVVTGGEPLLYQHTEGLNTLIDALVYKRRIEIETNGTIAPGPTLLRWQNITFNVSPKLAGPISDDERHRRLVPAALAACAALARESRARFKFVCAEPADLDAAAALCTEYRIPARQVWIMPAGTDPGTVLDRARRLADGCLARGYNLSLRQHVLLWPDTDRGR
jgi:7-carboxy-7-deazaguanine synthase